jgi:hypothetical protein
VVDHAVPLGETEVERHQSVHAVDGQIGQVEGVMVNPVSAVASVEDGIRLNSTKRQVGDLPPLGQPG